MNNMLPTPYQQFIHKSRYARWLDDEQRRENWDETVSRYTNFMRNQVRGKHNYEITDTDMFDIEQAILSQEIMPSMRAMMTAGPALARDNICGYNCSYIPVDSPRSFDECMYILMCGTGVGFSVERENVDKLPIVSDTMNDTDTVIKVGDSKPGWAKSLRELIALLYAGQIPKWDLSAIRPSGARLKTMGGRASGPKPLNDLFTFTVKLFKKAKGRRLFPIECHDLMCKVGEVVVVGGVRRSALISLSNLGDEQMRHAKTGEWYDEPERGIFRDGQRGLANNSVAYKGKPEIGTFMREWLALYDSKTGERGIFNRQAADVQVARNGRRETGHMWGTNPCSEIILRPYQFCNLSEVVVRESDTLDSLKRKVRLATILGTLQSTLTDFKYLRKVWKDNTEDERLLGVSLTGIMDHSVLSKSVDSPRWLEEMRQVAVDTNKEYAERLGIPQSAAITCVKPSGTVSQLVDAASGIHARHNDYYIRTVRADNKDPLTQFLKEQGVYSEADVTKPDTTTVFSFAMRSPDAAVTRTDMTAIEQLELWKTYAIHWCEHKPSVTISVKEHEWMGVGAWIYDNFDVASGVSFLPHTDHSYQQAPYQDIEREEYLEWQERFGAFEIDWAALSEYEKEDNTSGSRELACTAGSCEIVDLNAA
uniref:Ribonucleotide reductase n=1 Tax=uncultured virus TaxID=340016 RepID=A0A0A0UYB9_9VIRU|nr:ribonucleotide reductase [uncultured virus]